MKSKKILLSVGAAIGLAMAFTAEYYFRNSQTEKTFQTSSRLEQKVEEKEFTIANWNLQVFGDAKAAKPELMKKYRETIDDYDIVFVQELRDSDGSSFSNLCSTLTNYEYRVSSRAGRSSSKEQYGVIYKKEIQVMGVEDFNPDEKNRWERPPIRVDFDVEGYKFSAYNIHTKPDDVANEIKNLEGVVSTQGNIIVLGDLNADGKYYINTGKDFSSWNWLIKDEQDTTVASTDCAYDRLIVNQNMQEKVVSSGIFTNGITEQVSDHYVIWAKIKAKK